MKNSSLKIKGIVPPIVTPLHEQSRLDAEGLDRLVSRVVGGGVHGIFALGTTGEAPSLDEKLKREVVERVCAKAKGKIPVLVGITDTSFTESLKLADYAAEKGASALVVAPPYYFPCGQAELLEYIGHLVERLPLPLMLYNMPGMTKVSFEVETVRKALEIPGVIGLKDSSGNMGYFHKVRSVFAGRPEKSLLVGPEELLAESVLFGGDGGVNGGANLFPRLYVDLYEAAAKKDFATVEKLHRKVILVGSSLYEVGRYGSSLIKGMKCALKLLGVCDDFMAEPFHRFKAEERAIVEKALERLQVELASA